MMMDTLASQDPRDRPVRPSERVDEACDQFEAAWRAGQSPRIDDYLADAHESDRPALEDELKALERELRGSEQTSARAQAIPPLSAKLEAPTFPPVTVAFTPSPRAAAAAIHDAATLTPGETTGQPRNPDPGAPSATETPTARIHSPFADTVSHDQAGWREAAAASPTRIRYFGDYEIISEIARGGMGVVFRARQMSLNRPVALKMILAGQLANETEVLRFHTEAESAANLDHPGIVPIFEVGQHEGQHYFSMGFVEGQSLSQSLMSGPLPPREAAALLAKVADAIEYAHRRGVIHRDLKPANILIDAGGRPRVTDFGLAKKLQSDSALTRSGQIMGTPSYMPPEQAAGGRGEVGPAADVYALGATLFALLTGRPPFQAATAMDTVLQVISDEPVPPRRLNASVPVDLETICLKCLEKQPGKRYAAAADLEADLRRFLSDEPIVARPVTRIERVVKWVRRRPAIAALSASIALVTVVSIGLVVWQWRAAVQAGIVAQQRRFDAERAEAKEREQTQLAQQRLQDALRAQAGEKKQTDLAEQRLYDARMNLVQGWWENYHGARLQGGLDEQLPVNPGGTDRRGFEWFYWRRKLSTGYLTLNGHGRPVPSVAFGPDGQTLASASEDGTVKVWDPGTGTVIRTLMGHTGAVASVAFSRDGRLASSGEDHTVKVWDPTTGTVIRTLRGHSDAVISVAFSPDGSRLASAGRDKTVKVWDAGSGEVTLSLEGHNDAVARVAFRPDGRRLASASEDHTVKVWDAESGKVINTLRGHIDSVASVAFSSDGRRLASCGVDQTVKVWDPEAGTLIRTLAGHSGVVFSVAFSPDGRDLASGGWDGAVKLWDPETGQQKRTLRGHTNIITSVAFSPDGHLLAASGEDRTVKVWDVAAGPGTVILTGHDDGVHTVSFSPDSRTIASASYDRTVKLWDVENARLTRTLKGHTDIVPGLAFSPDGKWVASASNDTTVKVWDTATGKVIRTLTGHDLAVRALAYRPRDGHRLASASSDQTVKVWDPTTGKEICTLTGHTGVVAGVAFSPDGQWLASASYDGTVKVWDPATGKPVHNLKGHKWTVHSVAFSPDGKSLASASWDDDVKLWDTATGRVKGTLSGHTGMVWSVAYSPDGLRLASAAFDGTVRIWDAATGLELLSLKEGNARVTSVAFSPDGHRLASAGYDGTVKVWDARPLDPEPSKPDRNSH
jgi:WD40 repeat protein